MNPKLSFLIPAHNEEKIIAKTLSNLLNLPYGNYEVIIGLDGCTDNTEKIVREYEKKSGKFKHFNLNLRQGKPAVINTIIKKAKGEIIIINDADWIFKVKNKESLEKFLSVFINNKIGGIAESFPVELQNDKLNKGNFGFKMVVYSSYFWLDFQKKRFTAKKNKVIYLKEPTMFLTDIFRKKLYKENFSLGDDFERTKNIMDAGYEVILFDDINMPRMTAVYNKISIIDLFRQKVRTAMAREQLKGEQKIGLSSYYLPSVWHIFKEGWKKGFSVGFIVTFWIFLTVFATLTAKFKRADTKEGWKLRLKR